MSETGEISSHELARRLLEVPDLPVEIRVDVTTGGEGKVADLSVTAGEYFGINDKSGKLTGCITLLFGGILNYKVKICKGRK